jgi:hypothetical protein
MHFLFHTLIKWDALRVYYSIYHNGPTEFYAEVQDNPHGVGATDFALGHQWNAESGLSERVTDFLPEDVMRWKIARPFV